MSDPEDPPQRKVIFQLLDLTILDYVIIAVFGLLVLVAREAGMSLPFTLAIVAIGVWLISKPSDWIADGVIHVGIYFGISDYVLGIISSLTAILGELVIAVISAYMFYKSGQTFLISFAVLTTLFSIVFNMIILGAIIAVKGEREIKVPDPVIARELEIIDMVFVLSFLIATIWLVNALIAGKEQIIIPREAALLFPTIYFVYLARMVKISKREVMDDAIYREAGIKVKPKRPEITRFQAFVLIAFGALLTILGGELIVSNVETLVKTHSEALATIGEPVMVISMLIGFSSAIYDMVISLRYTSEGRVLISIGGLIGSVPPLFMVVIGIIGILFGIPVEGRTVLLLVSMALTMLYLRHAITDDKKLDSYEGTILVLLQIVTLILILRSF